MRKVSALSPVVLLGILAFLVLVVPNGLYSAFDKDEPKYLEASYEMVKTGDYITPRYNYELRFDKPILVYWLISLGYKVFGVNEFGGRFFVSLFGVLTVILVYLWLREDRKLALWSALVLLSLVDFAVMASTAMPDIVLTFFISASIISFYFGFYVLSAVFSGLAVITKGPVGVVIPSMVLALYLVMKRRFKNTLTEIPIFSMLIAFCVVTLPWYVLIFIKHGWNFFKEFIIFHNIYRFTSKIPGHPTHWWYYFANYFWIFLPFSLSFFSAIKRLWKEKELVMDDKLLLSFCWFFSVFLFFQMAKTKLAHYLLPAFPPFSVIIASHLLKEEDSLTRFGGSLLLIVLGIFGIAYLVFSKAPLISFVLPLVVLGGGVYGILRNNCLKVFVTTSILSFVILKFLVLPSLEPLRAKPVIGKELRNLKEKSPNLKVYFLNYHSPEVVFYYRSGKIPEVDCKKANEILNSEEKVLIVTRENRLKCLKNYKILLKKKELLTKHNLVVLGGKGWKISEKSR